MNSYKVTKKVTDQDLIERSISSSMRKEASKLKKKQSGKPEEESSVFSLAALICEQNNDSEKGKLGELRGWKTLNRHAKTQDSFLKHKQAFLQQARELEQKGWIAVDWYDGKSDIGDHWIKYDLNRIDEIYQFAGMEHPKYQLQSNRKALSDKLKNCKPEWLRDYLQSLLTRTEKGKRVKELENVNFLKAVDGFLKMQEMNTNFMYKRVFSIAFLGQSKIFEEELQSHFITAAKRFHPEVTPDMADQQVLEQIGILEYVSAIYLKGPLQLSLDGKKLCLEKFPYGVELNTQTMKKAVILPEQSFSRIMTIENKANFEAEKFREDTLFIFAHGYPGPLEREFLLQLRSVLQERNRSIDYLHSSDLDYGGVCIFQYIRKRIFPEVKPYRMDGETYAHYRQKKYGYTIEKTTMEKLEKIEEPLLAELIECLKREKIGIEQECFLVEEL